MELVGTVPTTLMGRAVKAASAVLVSGPTIANTTVSNVPGPTDPIFFAGARLLRVTGLGALIGGMNLFHIVASYHGTVSIGVTADRRAARSRGRAAQRSADHEDDNDNYPPAQHHCGRLMVWHSGIGDRGADSLSTPRGPVPGAVMRAAP